MSTATAGVAAGTRATAATLPQARARDARVDLLRTLCVLCIVFLHFPWLSDALRVRQHGIDSLAVEARDAISNGLLYMALPALTFISGYIAWGGDGEKRYGALLRAKIRSLLVPMLIWNGVVLAASLAVQRQGFASGLRIGLADMNAGLVVDALLGVFHNPVNYPLHFLRDLFVLFALWPIWAWLIRHTPMFGLAIVAAVFMSNLDGNLVRRDTMAVTFYMGLLFGSRVWSIGWLDRYTGRASICLILMAGSLVWLGPYDPGDPLRNAVVTSIKLVAPPLIWSAAGFLQGTAVSRWLALISTFTFPMFLMHAPILQVWYRLLPVSVTANGVSNSIAWIGASVLTVATCIVTCQMARRLWPRAAAVAFGGR